MKTIIALLLCLASMAVSAGEVTLKGAVGSSCEYAGALLRPDGSIVFECKGNYTGHVAFPLGGPGSPFVMTTVCVGQQYAIRFTKTSDANTLVLWGNFFQRIRTEIFGGSPAVVTPAATSGYTNLPIAGAPNRELVVMFSVENDVPGYAPCNAVLVEVF